MALILIKSVDAMEQRIEQGKEQCKEQYKGQREAPYKGQHDASILSALIAPTSGHDDEAQSLIFHTDQPASPPPSSLFKAREQIHSLKDEVQGLKRKLSELELRVGEGPQTRYKHTQLFERLLHQLPCGVVMLDGKGVIEHINDYATRLFSHIEVGESWLSVIQTEFSPRDDDGHEISLRNGRRVTLDTASLDDASGQIVILLDLTETRNLQSQLSHQQRLAEMGKMMASLAHQIRTPLSTAMLYGSHLTETVEEDAQRVRYAGKLQNRLECINQQITDMLVYVRGSVELEEWIEVGDLFSEIEAHCEDVACAEGGTLNFSYDESELVAHQVIRCNKISLVGAFGNLIQNAFQAQALPVNVDLQADFDGNSHINIRVSDNGPGLNDEQAKQIFTPFYTTKSVGTGLGLPIVKTVIEAHDGKISVFSDRDDLAADTGCCFLVSLPCMTSGKEAANNRVRAVNSGVIGDE